MEVFAVLLRHARILRLFTWNGTPSGRGRKSHEVKRQRRNARAPVLNCTENMVDLGLGGAFSARESRRPPQPRTHQLGVGARRSLRWGRGPRAQLFPKRL